MYLTYFITPESPRWLVTQGRMEDAKEVLTKIAETNKSKVPDDIEVFIGRNTFIKIKVSQCPEIDFDTISNTIHKQT